MLTNTAIILAGGKSKRMGFDKQQLMFDSKLAAVYMADLLSREFEDIIIVSNKPNLYVGTRYTIHEDIIKDFGPLGGLYTGLIHSKSQFAYLLACDMPNVNLDYIRYMKSLLEQDATPDALITLYGDNKSEPFNAFYSKSNIEKIQTLFKAGTPRIKELFEPGSTRYISEAEARKFSHDWSMFRNLNTMHDLKKFDHLPGSVQNSMAL